MPSPHIATHSPTRSPVRTATAWKYGGIANQTIEFGALTLASAGGAKALDTNGDEVNFVSVDSVVSGTGTGWSVSGGRLIRSSTPATSDGAVLRCTTSLGVIDVTISATANTYSVATDAQLVDVFAIATATVAGKTIKLRPGNYNGPGSAGVEITFKSYGSVVTLTSHNTSKRAYLTNGITITTSTNVTVSNLNIYRTSANNIVIFTLIGPCDNIIIDNNAIYGTDTVNVTGDYSAGWYTNFFGIAMSDAAGDPIDVTITNNVVHSVNLAISTGTTGALVVSGNTIYSYYQIGLHIGGVPTSTTLNDNIIYHPFSLPSDTGNPHSDAIILLGGSFNWSNIEIKRNRIWRGNTRGASQGIFLANLTAGYYYTCNISNNFVCQGAQLSLYVNRIGDGSVIQNNTLVGPADQPYNGPDRTETMGLILGEDASTGTIYVYDNIAEYLTLLGSATYTQDNNITLGREVGPYTNYNAAFDGTTSFDPDMLGDVMALFNMQVGGSADNTYNAGAIGNGYVDFGARTYTAPNRTAIAVDNAGAVYGVDSTFSGGSGSKQGTIVLSFYIDEGSWPASNKYLLEFSHVGYGQSLILYTDSVGRLVFYGNNASNTGILGAVSAISTFSHQTWHTIAISWNLATGTLHWYSGDSQISYQGTPTTTNDTIRTSDRASVFSNQDGTVKMDGWLAEVWVDLDTYYDLSDTTTRRNFINASGKPVDKTGFGSPHLYLKEAVADWFDNTNGSGGALTETGGTLAAAGSSPSD